MLLTSVRAAIWLHSIEMDPHTIVVTGRCASAFFATMSVLAITLIAYLLNGVMAATLTTVLTGTGILFVYAHDMKEDTALLFGMTWFFLFAIIYERRSYISHAMFLGMTAGLAASGKYVGLLSFFLGIWLIVHVKRQDYISHFTIYFISALSTFLLINMEMLWAFGKFFEGFTRETSHAAKGHYGAADPVTSTLYLRFIATYATVAIPFYLYALAFYKNRSGFSERMILFFPLIYVFILQLTPLKGERYALPVILIMQLIGAAQLAELLKNRTKFCSLFLSACAGTWLTLNLLQLYSSYDAITNSNRIQLAKWIKEKLPPNATIAEESIVGLSQDDKKAFRLSQTIVSRPWISDFRSLRDMRDAGIDYVAISDLNEPWFREVANNSKADKWFLSNAEVYRSLIDGSSLLFSANSKGPYVSLFSPGLALYKIR
jgi:hypothetical protein